jgi:hypothetical protein
MPLFINEITYDSYTTTQRNALTVTAGTLIYNSDTQTYDLYNGSVWIAGVTSATTTMSSLSSVGTITTGVWNASIISIAYGGTNSSTALSNNRIMISSGGKIVEQSAIAASVAIVSDANGLPVASATTATEIGYVSGVTSAIQTQINAKVNRSGDTMTGALILNADPITALGAATKQYVDNNIQGLQTKPTAKVATTAALAANTYNNGSSGVGATLTGNVNGSIGTIDTYTIVVNDLILVKNESTAANNGLYTVTQVGTVGTPYILTRQTDMQTTNEFAGAFVPVSNAGFTNANSLWLANPSTPVVVGTTNIPFTQLNGATDLIAGTGITLSGNTISISVSYVGQTSITTLGAITTGTWNASVISTTYTQAQVISISGVSGRTTITGTATVPIIDISASYVGQTTITTLGTITTGTWNGTTIAIANGGTGATTANAAFNNLSPLTTKGDLLVYTTVNARLAVGTNGQILMADSTQTSGVKWATVLKNKAGIVAGASFAGSPKTFAVTFTTAFVDNNYTIAITGEDARTFHISSKTSAGFTINANSSSALSGNTFWTATYNGESA